MNFRAVILTLAFIISNFLKVEAQDQASYGNYYKNILTAEKLITENKFSEALIILDSVFDSYDFIFLKDYKVATQLAVYLEEEEKALGYLKMGISNGWTRKSIKNNKFLKPLHKTNEWKTIKSQYDSLRTSYLDQLNTDLRNEVNEMFKNDQKYAFSYLFKIGNKAKTRFLHKKFIPQSERQILRLNQILDDYGYPGAKLIGNWVWMSTILSHHNSISIDYVQKDSLYPMLKPRLLEATQAGEMSPYEYATIEDWYVVIKSGRKEAAFGYLHPLERQDLRNSNKLRQAIGMRSVETRNALIDIQKQTGMDFYLEGSPWIKGKIIIKR